MRATPNGNRAAVVQRHVARPANRKAHHGVAAQAVAKDEAVAAVKDEAQAADRVTVAQALAQPVAVAQVESTTAAQAANSARLAARHAPSRPQARQALARALVAPHAVNSRVALHGAGEGHGGSVAGLTDKVGSLACGFQRG